jgi:hypothetical protein
MEQFRVLLQTQRVGICMLQFYVLWKLEQKCNYPLLLAAEHPLIGFVWAEVASDSQDEQQITFDLTDGSFAVRTD